MALVLFELPGLCTSAPAASERAGGLTVILSIRCFGGAARRAESNKTRRLLANRLAPGSSRRRVRSKERLRVGSWIVPGLDDDAVKEAVELCFLVAF